MSEPGHKIDDLLGVKPLAEATNTLAKGAVDGASAFLSRICLPAAEELGLLLRDKVSTWRANNAVKITLKAEQKYQELPNHESKHAHPRLAWQILEEGSWIEADEVQSLWAGLLASSCTDDGKDDSNLMFVDLLARLTLSEARMLDHVCKSAEKIVTPAGWVAAELFVMTLVQLKDASKLSDLHRIDRELDHLRTLGLLNEKAGFGPYSTDANVTPSPLALQMYARCQGCNGDPLSFFGLTAPEKGK